MPADEPDLWLDAGGTEYDVWIPGNLTPESWIEVSKGGLPQTVGVKVRVSRSGKPVVIAMRIDEGQEITGRHLRSIRVADIAAAVMRHVVATKEDMEHDAEMARAELKSRFSEEEIDQITPSIEGGIDSGIAMWMHEAGANAMQLSDWIERAVDRDAPPLDGPRGRGARTPSNDEYAAFARVYLEERVADPRKAASRAAERTHMTRGTAYRWIAACQERDLLPKEL